MMISMINQKQNICSEITHTPFKSYKNFSTDDQQGDDNDNLEHPGQTWYRDADGDGYSNGMTNTTSCIRTFGYKTVSELTASSGDCNEADPNVNPATYWYSDSDGDGYGDPSVSLQQCIQSSGYVLNNTDSNDSDPDIYPGGPSVRTSGVTTTYYAILQDAYNASAVDDNIESQAVSFAENLNINLNKNITLQGGYNSGYTSVTGKTTINGNVTISDGKITIGDIIIK